MPHLTFPVGRAALTLPVLIGLDGPTSAKRQATGQPIPVPASATALIDTGSNVTCVEGSIVRGLGLPPLSGHSTTTVSGTVPVDLFEVSLSISGAGGAAGPMLVEPYLLVMELPRPIPGIGVLIGMDLLSKCLLIVDGPGGQLTLAF